MTRGRSIITLPAQRPVILREHRVPQIHFFPWLGGAYTSGAHAGAWIVQEWGMRWTDSLAYRPDRTGD